MLRSLRVLGAVALVGGLAATSGTALATDQTGNASLNAPPPVGFALAAIRPHLQAFHLTGAFQQLLIQEYGRQDQVLAAKRTASIQDELLPKWKTNAIPPFAEHRDVAQRVDTCLFGPYFYGRCASWNSSEREPLYSD